MAQNKKTLSVTQAAKLCGVGRTTVGYWIRSRKLRATRTGHDSQDNRDQQHYGSNRKPHRVAPDV